MVRIPVSRGELFVVEVEEGTVDSMYLDLPVHVGTGSYVDLKMPALELN